MKSFERSIGGIAARLFNEGLEAETYNKEQALKILNNHTVAPEYCISVLNAHEAEIIEKMKTFTRTF